MLIIATDRRHQRLGNAKYCLSHAVFDPARLPNERMNTTKLYAGPCSDKAGFARHSRALSVALGSSLRDNNFATGIP